MGTKGGHGGISRVWAGLNEFSLLLKGTFRLIYKHFDMQIGFWNELNLYTKEPLYQNSDNSKK